MNGAAALIHTLVAAGVDTCFANPGTSEMHFVAALDRVPGLVAVPTLAEGVATGAADGYGRIAEKPAATLLHCGPGLANGLANLHNAKKAGTPVVNLIGDQAHGHRPLDPPLAAETENLARTVSAWTHTCLDVHAVGSDAATAVAMARAEGGCIASLILPSDVCWQEGAVPSPAVADMPRGRIDDARIARIASLLALAKARTVLLLGGDALHGRGLAAAGRIAQKTGVRLMTNTSIRKLARGRGRPEVQRIPYGVEPAVQSLANTTHLVLAGARRPVLAFAGPSGPARPEPDGVSIPLLATPEQDITDALERLAERLGCPVGGPPPSTSDRPSAATGAVTPQAFAASLAALLPDGSIVVDEGVTFGRDAFHGTARAAPHDWLSLTGGAIGSGIPMATGAALAGQGRRVVNLQADGSALYTVQGLWTQARARLDVTTIIFSNRRYAILFNEMQRVHAVPGAQSAALLSLDDPALDWVRIAQGFGVETARVDNMADFNRLFERSVRTRGPFLIELMVP